MSLAIRPLTNHLGPQRIHNPQDNPHRSPKHDLFKKSDQTPPPIILADNSTLPPKMDLVLFKLSTFPGTAQLRRAMGNQAKVNSPIPQKELAIRFAAELEAWTKKAPDDEALFLVDGAKQQAYVVVRNGSSYVFTDKVPVSTGSDGFGFPNKNNKYKRLTPVGIFKIRSLTNAKMYEQIQKENPARKIIRPRTGKKAYLTTAAWYLGISNLAVHGTNRTNRLGKKASDGCIRMKNEDIRRLTPYVMTGQIKRVLITDGGFGRK